MKQHFTMFAAYNAWANGLLYDAAGKLSEEEFNRDASAFFKSMCGTLNHVLVADRIWMQRFTGEGDALSKLDTILHPRLDDLREARQAEDLRITGWVDTLDDASLAGEFSYTPITIAETITQKLAPALAHFFNHQTHHRGHAHMILSVLGKQPPSLDLIYFQRTQAGRKFI